MSGSDPVYSPPGSRRLTREVLVYDLLLVALNVGFMITIYFTGQIYSGPAANGAIPIEGATRIAMLGVFWCLGNIGLIIGLIAAMRRANVPKGK